MRWRRAYNFNINNDVSIDKAMRMRKENDPRSGDLHCCKECYESNTGFQILTRDNRKNGKVDCFAKWPGKSGGFTGICKSSTLATSRRESMDYALFYHEFERYLQDLEKNCEPYFIDEVSKPTGDDEPDFMLEHSSEIPIPLVETHIVILDENKRREKRFSKTMLLNRNVGLIVVKISEYTADQLLDFQRGGIDKFQIQWDILCSLIEKRQQEKAAAEEREEREAEEEAELLADHQEPEHSRLHYIFRLSGPWLLTGTKPTIEVRAKTRGLDLDDLQTGRYLGKDVCLYLNKYFPQKFLTSDEQRLTKQHVIDNSKCPYCRDTGVKMEFCCGLPSDWEDGQIEIECDAEMTATDVFTLFTTYGTDVSCPNCPLRLYEHFGKERRHEHGSWDWSRSVKAIFSLVDENYRIPLKSFIQVKNPYNRCRGAGFDVHQYKYSFYEVVELIAENGCESKCQYCDYPLLDHIEKKSYNNIYPFFSWYGDGAKNIFDHIEKVDGEYRISIERLLEFTPPVRKYNEICKEDPDACNNGITQVDCKCGKGLRVACGEPSYPPKIWNLADIRFQKSDSTGNFVELVCPHCKQGLDSFEVKFPNIDKEIWTVDNIVDRIYPIRDADRSEKVLSSLECALLNSIGRPDIWSTTEEVFISDGHREKLSSWSGDGGMRDLLENDS